MRRIGRSAGSVTRSRKSATWATIGLRVFTTLKAMSQLRTALAMSSQT